jgi:D-beta-D-heptose 7-phosphate kinase/D-beta-D-heptose 1-phosphate adenosyltransferase
MDENTNLINIVEAFNKAKVLVFGDCMLDVYITGAVDRISPEAPVPVVKKTNVANLPGGASNVAMNIASLGGVPYLIGTVGDDYNAEIIFKLLKKNNISSEYLYKTDKIPTTIKMRIVGGTQQIVRLDTEEILPPDDEYLEKLKRILNSIDDVDCILVSDYGKGMIVPETLDLLRVFSEKWDASIVVDPKESHFENYYGVDLITPNHKEAGKFIDINIRDETSMKEAGRKFLEKVKCKAVLITWGERGMVLFEDEDVFPIPTFAREVYDVVGAGDTVIATIALAVSAGCDYRTSALLSNHSAGIVVGKMGTATVSADELKMSLKEYYYG